MSEPRNYLEEARSLLRGDTLMLPQIEHLRALREYHDWCLIDVAHKLDALKKDVMEME